MGTEKKQIANNCLDATLDSAPQANVGWQKFIEKSVISKNSFAGFWRRLLAYWIDAFIVACISTALLHLVFRIHNTNIIILAVAAINTLYFLYRPFCHQRWGKTFGKFCLKIFVTAPNKELSWARVLLREIFFIPPIVLGLVSIVIVVGKSSNIGNYSDFTDSITSFNQNGGAFFNHLKLMTTFIIIIDGLFILFHSQKKALHDLIAKTAVLNKLKPVQEAVVSAEPISCLQCGANLTANEAICPNCGWSYDEQRQ